MDPIHKEALDSNHTLLVQSMRGSDVIGKLLVDDVISKYDYDQIRRTEAQGGRAVNRLLLLTLKRRGGEGAYPCLQAALRVTGQTELCDALLDTELNLREGLATDRCNSHLHNPAHSKLPALDLKRGSSWEDNTSPRPDHLFDSSPSTRRTNQHSPLFRGTPTSPRRPNQRSPLGRTTPWKTEEERRLQEVREEMEELKAAYSRREAELEKTIEQLKKEKQEGTKEKGGGCVLM